MLVPTEAATFPEIRVAAVIDGAEITGPIRQLAAIISPLAARGVVLRPVVFQRHGRVASHIAFLRAHGATVEVLHDTRAFDPQPLRQLREFLHAWRPHIVQTHGYRPTALAFLLGRKGRPWKWIGWHHGTTTENLKVRLYHAVDRQLLPAADRVVVVARSQAPRFAAAGQRIEVIHNAAIETALGTIPTSPIALPPNLPAPVVAVVGRLSSEKGQDTMLRAMALLKRQGMGASLLLAGDGPERTALERLAEQLGLRNDVHFLGHVTDILPVYRSADIVALPSRSEGLPNALLEALRADCPVVATDVGAISEVLQDASAGLVVSPDDPAALATAVRQAWATGRTDAAQTARAATLRRFSLDVRVQRHMELYRSLR